MSEDVLEQQYNTLYPVLTRCEEEVRTIVIGLIGSMGGGQLIRAQLRDHRVKGLASVRAKVRRHSIDPTNLLTVMGDLVGFRIVCNNLEDLRRIKDLLLSSSRFKLVEEQDYVKNPQSSGYRALHLSLGYEVTGPITTNVLCEFQIRTFAQEMWANLAHYDLYRRDEDVPQHIIKSSQRLAMLLSLADEHAQDILEEVSQPMAGAVGSSESPELPSLALIYQRAYGSSPPDWLVRSVLRRCEEVGCFRLDLLDRAVTDEKAREALKEAYRKEANWDISNEELFELCPDLAVFGLESAIALAASNGGEAWLEVVSVAKQDELSELPETLSEFENWPVVNYGVAGALDALTECSICGAPIVDVEQFVENLLDHYGEDEDYDMRIWSTVSESGIEVGDDGDSSLCSYHGYVMSKAC